VFANPDITAKIEVPVPGNLEVNDPSKLVMIKLLKLAYKNTNLNDYNCSKSNFLLNTKKIVNLISDS